jgi:hypothetical protein
MPETPHHDGGGGADIASIVQQVQNAPVPGHRSRYSVSKRSNVLKVRSSQLAALAHDVVGELLPLIQIAHAGTLDG